MRNSECGVRSGRHGPQSAATGQLGGPNRGPPYQGRLSPQSAQRARRTALTSAECAYQGSLSPQRARTTQRTAEVGFGTAAHARQACFGPNGAGGCSHGWSGAAAQRPDAEPVGGRRVPHPPLFAPAGRRRFLHPLHSGDGSSLRCDLTGRVRRIRTSPTGCAPPA